MPLQFILAANHSTAARTAASGALKQAEPVVVRASQVGVTAMPKKPDFPNEGEFKQAWNEQVPPLCQR